MKILKKFVKPLIILLIIAAVLGAGHHILKWFLSTNGQCDVCGKDAAELSDKLSDKGITEELCKDCQTDLGGYIY